MVENGLEYFRNKKVVFLQGPVGPFFKRLFEDFLTVNTESYKINFNGGDWFFAPNNSINFKGSLEEWPQFFLDFIEEHRIDTVILFGDCREYHRIAHTIAHQNNIEIGVFEEGYVRPDYITFERFGVNGFSLLPRNRDFYDKLETKETLTPDVDFVGNTFWHAAWYAFIYYAVSVFLSPLFRHYKHHRPLKLWEATYWIKAILKKWYFKYYERGIQDNLVKENSKNYFLAPLQISTDAQIREHSDFRSVEIFIKRIISSFSDHAPITNLLIIKHHPLDRGYHDYSELIYRLAAKHNIVKRVKYIHDQHLPTLLEHAKGVVLINSTVGLSAIHHSAPLKTCGTSIYDIDGLTYQGKLENFWNDADTFNVDRELYRRFKGYVINYKQINGNFYHRLKKSRFKSGILW
ncbi:MAG: capsular biosynthesis protein [Sulfuricurvum sp.]|uniref:capsule biosynthesis protein n=1 Tax=Sulfuricurvum sp. TaxID=2025608 RepID=UPI002628CC55|nr:capsular biosynthesis protein [Sulfuricurvum sp.]MDD5159929.1 capsular biosynthesis protein [Sulfuricurvum sp.]